MPKESLLENEQFMEELLAFTAQLEPRLSAPRIAERLSSIPGLRNVNQSTITTAWQAYGGRAQFVEKLSILRARKCNLARPRKDPELMTEAELFRFAKLYGKMPFPAAFAALRPTGPKISRPQFMLFLKNEKECRVLSDFFSRYGEQPKT